MGSAFVRVLSGEGIPVTVWNRNPARAHALAGPEVTVADSAVDAVRAAEVVVSILLDYDSLRNVIGDVELDGRAVVNLATGSVEDAAAMQAWVHSRGGLYLDGAIIAYPQNIGHDECMIVYSGSSTVFAEFRELLMRFGPASLHTGEQIDGANVLDGGISGAFMVSALAAFVESAAYVHRSGVSGEAVRAVTRSMMSVLQEQMDTALANIKAGSHATDQATVSVYSDAARSWQDAVEKSGQRATMLGAANKLLSAAEDSGLGSLGFSSLALLTGVHSG